MGLHLLMQCHFIPRHPLRGLQKINTDLGKPTLYYTALMAEYYHMRLFTRFPQINVSLQISQGGA